MNRLLFEDSSRGKLEIMQFSASQEVILAYLPSGAAPAQPRRSPERGILPAGIVPVQPQPRPAASAGSHSAGERQRFQRPLSKPFSRVSPARPPAVRGGFAPVPWHPGCLHLPATGPTPCGRQAAPVLQLVIVGERKFDHPALVPGIFRFEGCRLQVSPRLRRSGRQKKPARSPARRAALLPGDQSAGWPR